MLWNHYVQQYFLGDTCLYESNNGKTILVKVTKVQYLSGKYHYHVESLGERYTISAMCLSDKLELVHGRHSFHIPNEKELVTLVGGGS